MGLLCPWFGSYTCAVGGRAREGVSRLEEESLLPSARRELRVGRREDGELRRRVAPGQPQEECSVRRVVNSGEE